MERSGSERGDRDKDRDRDRERRADRSRDKDRDPHSRERDRERDKKHRRSRSRYMIRISGYYHLYLNIMASLPLTYRLITYEYSERKCTNYFSFRFQCFTAGHLVKLLLYRCSY